MKHLHKKTQKEKRIRKPWIYIFLFGIIFVFLYFFISRNKDGSKISIAYLSREKVHIVIIKKDSEEIIDLVLPSNLFLSLSYNLGEAKLKNILEIGYNEGYNGELLTRTIAKELNFPIYYWGDDCLDGIVNPSVLNFIEILSPTCKTNLNYPARINYFFLSARTGNYKKRTVELENSVLLKKEKLPDGDMGYKINEGVLNILLPYTLNPLLSIDDKPLLVRIVNQSGNRYVAERLGKLIESIGGKIIQIEEEKKTKLGCEVYSENNIFGYEMEMIYGCKIFKNNDSTTSEKIIIGEEFALDY